MKITIDTKEDSHSEIRKVISMLQALVGDSSTEETYSNRDIFSDSSPEVTPSVSEPASEPASGVFGNLFDNDKSDVVETSKTNKPEETKEPETDSDKDVEVIPY